MTGKTIVHYRVLERIGAGGMGVVYRATDTRLGRDVAIKFLPPTMLDGSARERFLREARAASLLNHHGICAVYDLGEFDGQPFLVMELLEGQTLRERIHARMLRTDEVFDFAQQIAEALAFAHSRGVVHRDVKSGNVLVTREGRIKILDFGLAKLTGAHIKATDEESPTRTSDPRGLTQMGSPVGTVAYMSPEQARGEAADFRSDLFSFGVMLYEMATGKLPFNGPTDAAVFAALLERTPEKPSYVRVGLPPELDSIVMKALEKDRDLRYQSAADMRAGLKRAARGSEPSSPSFIAPAVPRKRLPRERLAAAAVLTLAIAAAGYFGWQRYRVGPKLTGKDVIVLADIRNTTSDSMFDIALKQALAAQLEQSPFLKLLREDQTRAALRFMQRPADTAITAAVAREICVRDGLKAVVQSTLSALGTRFLLTLEAVDCSSGEVLAQETAESASKEQVLEAVSTTVARMRNRLGESIASIQRMHKPVEQATTPSLPAFQEYAQGERERDRGDFTSAIPHYRRALEIDPEFAIAYARLANMYTHAGDLKSARGCLVKALAFAGRTGEKERYYIQAHYAARVAGDSIKALEQWELLSKAYPRDPAALIESGMVLAGLGQFQKAYEFNQAALRIDPRNAVALGCRSSLLLDLNRPNEARETARAALSVVSNTTGLYTTLWQVAALKGETSEMRLIEKLVAGGPEEYRIVDLQRNLALQQGRFQRAAELPQNSAAGELGHAVSLALAGNCAAASGRVEHALTLIPEGEAGAAPGFARAWCGDDAGARSSIDAMLKAFPIGTRTTRIDVPAVKAALSLKHARYQQALMELQPALAYDAAFPPAWYLRGLAYMQLKRPSEAAAEFQKVIDTPGRSIANGAGWPLANLECARAWAMAGDNAKAKSFYAAFLNAWKDADPALPQLAEANRELAALNKSAPKS